MKHYNSARLATGAVFLASLVAHVAANAQGAPRISLSPSFLEVEWVPVNGNTDQVPIAQGNVADPNVVVHWYGSAAEHLLTSGSPDNPGRPFSVWSGECAGPFAITFSRRDNLVDLTGLAKMRWVVKTSGFHAVRPVIKLADGTMLVGDMAASAPPMMTELEFTFAGVRWVQLDPERVVTVADGASPRGEIWVDDVDLSSVEEIGFADLMPASGHGAGGFIHLGDIEVFGNAVPRGRGPT
jgi:hypothetical protein